MDWHVHRSLGYGTPRPETGKFTSQLMIISCEPVWAKIGRYRLGELFIWLFSSSLVFLLFSSNRKPITISTERVGKKDDGKLSGLTACRIFTHRKRVASWKLEGKRNGSPSHLEEKVSTFSRMLPHPYHGVLFPSRPFSAKGSKWPGMTCRKKTIDWNARKKVPHSHCVRFLKELCW